MKNPCDERKERKEISTVANVIFCFEFKFFFCYWDIRQFRLTTSVDGIEVNGFLPPLPRKAT